MKKLKKKINFKEWLRYDFGGPLKSKENDVKEVKVKEEKKVFFLAKTDWSVQQHDSKRLIVVKPKESDEEDDKKFNFGVDNPSEEEDVEEEFEEEGTRRNWKLLRQNRSLKKFEKYKFFGQQIYALMTNWVIVRHRPGFRGSKFLSKKGVLRRFNDLYLNYWHWTGRLVDSSGVILKSKLVYEFILKSISLQNVLGLDFKSGGISSNLRSVLMKEINSRNLQVKIETFESKLFSVKRNSLDVVFYAPFGLTGMRVNELFLVREFFWLLLLYYPERTFNHEYKRRFTPWYYMRRKRTRKHVISKRLYKGNRIRGGNLYLETVLKNLVSVDVENKLLNVYFFKAKLYSDFGEDLGLDLAKRQKFRMNSGVKDWDDSAWLSTSNDLGLEKKDFDYFVEYKLLKLFFWKDIIRFSAPSVAKTFYEGLFLELFRKRLLSDYASKYMYYLTVGNDFVGVSTPTLFGCLLLFSLGLGILSDYIWFDFWFVGHNVIPIAFSSKYWFAYAFFFFLGLYACFVEAWLVLVSFYFRYVSMNKELRHILEEDLLAEERYEIKVDEELETRDFCYHYFLDFPFYAHFKFSPYNLTDRTYRQRSRRLPRIKYSPAFYRRRRYRLHRQWFGLTGSRLAWDTYSYWQNLGVARWRGELSTEFKSALKLLEILRTVDDLATLDYIVARNVEELWHRNRILYKWYLLLMVDVEDTRVVHDFLLKFGREILQLEYILFRRVLVLDFVEELEHYGDGSELAGNVNWSVVEWNSKELVKLSGRDLIEVGFQLKSRK